MNVDATWPLGLKGMGVVVNENFVRGQNQQIACEPVKSWVVPDNRNAQEFKDKILRESFTAKELAHREEFIKTLGVMTNSRWIKFLLKLETLIKRMFGK
jgi:hypothetical protein